MLDDLELVVDGCKPPDMGSGNSLGALRSGKRPYLQSLFSGAPTICFVLEMFYSQGNK